MDRKPEPDRWTKEPPELGPEDGLSPDTVAGGATLSDSDPDGDTQGKEPQDTLKGTGWSRGEPNDGDSQAARDPDTTKAAEDAEPTPYTHEGEASEAKEEPETQTTEEPMPDGTADGNTPDRLIESRNSKETRDGLEGSRDDRARTPKPTASPTDDPVTKEHRATSGDGEAETAPGTTIGRKEQNREPDRSGPNKPTDADPGAIAKLGDTPLTSNGREKAKVAEPDREAGNTPNTTEPGGDEGLTHSNDEGETSREETGPKAPNEHGESNDSDAPTAATTTVPPEVEPESGDSEDTTTSETAITEADPVEEPDDDANTLSQEDSDTAKGTSHSCTAEDRGSEEDSHRDAEAAVRNTHEPVSKSDPETVSTDPPLERTRPGKARVTEGTGCTDSTTDSEEESEPTKRRTTA